MNTTKTKLTTKRLSLIPISAKYRQDIFDEFTNDITTFMFPQPTGQIKDIDDFITESLDGMKKGTNLQFVALEKKTKEFLGCVGLHHINRRDPEMGIWIKKKAHGNKYGQEAMKAVKEWADKHLNYEHIKYPVAVKNIASRKVAESLGGKEVKEYVGENQLGQKMKEVEYWIYKKEDKTTKKEMLELIRFHFPKLKFENTKLFNKGWDHDAVLLDNKLLFRFPKDRDYKRFKKGVELLDILRKRVKVPIPTYKYVSPLYNIGGYQKIEGEQLLVKVFKKLNKKQQRSIAKELADFLTAIHTTPLKQVRPLIHWEPWGIETHWKQDYEKKKKLIFSCFTEEEKKTVKRLYFDFLKLDIPNPKTLIHWDLSDDHIFINPKTKKISGIIDFSDAGIGDPAMDFTWLWEFGEEFIGWMYEDYKGKKDKDFILRTKYYFTLMFVNIMYHARKRGDEKMLQRSKRDFLKALKKTGL